MEKFRSLWQSRLSGTVNIQVQKMPHFQFFLPLFLATKPVKLTNVPGA